MRFGFNIYFLKNIIPGIIQYFSDYKTHWTIRHTQVVEEENRKKNFEAKNVVKYLITSFKAEILFCFDIPPQFQ